MTIHRLAPLLGLVLLGLCPAVHAALSFPMQYVGRWRLTVSVTNANGSGQCSDTAAATMILQSDGTAIWRADEITAHIQTPTGQPPSCEIRPSGQTVSWFGTHDKVSSFSLPSGSSLPPINGSFDEQDARAEYRVGNHTLMEWKLPAVGHLVAIEPDPSVGFDFHKDLLAGKGFRFVFSDPHGRDHLDFDTLRVLVGGVDTTQHLLHRVIQGIVPATEETRDANTKAFHVRPDPTRLMEGHDLFAIPYNGDWRIELRICDKGGTCFDKVYDKVYFGPFVSASKAYRVIDGRCLTPPDPFVRVQQVTVGNTGVHAPRTAIFVGLTNAATGTWTFSPGDVGLGVPLNAWFQGQVQPLAQLPLASGFLKTYDLQELPDSLAVVAGTGAPGLRRTSFTGGEFTLVLAALDADTGGYRRDEHAVTMCDR